MDDVLRAVGRNLLLFQQVEGLFKFLLANAQAHGFAATLADEQTKKSERVHRQTLGQLIVQYTEELGGGARPPAEPAHPSMPWFSYTFEIESHPDFPSIRADRLASLLRERNDLVHHFITRSDLSSVQGRTAALADLDRQRDLINALREPLTRIVKDLELTARAMGEYFASLDFRQAIESGLAAPSPLVAHLRDIAASKGGAGGWTLLSTAGQLLRQRAPEEVDALFKRHGHRTLRSFLQASKEFELQEETTPRGGVRLAYRPKS
jgi:hypothetical protein